MAKTANKIEKVSFKKERGSKETFWLSFIFKNSLALEEEIAPKTKVKINKKASQNKTLFGLKIGCSIFSSSISIFEFEIVFDEKTNAVLDKPIFLFWQISENTF